MLKNKRQNFHHSKLPKIGAIITVNIRPLKSNETARKFIVTSYPLNDSADPKYSLGIHTVNIEALDNRNESHVVSGHHCETIF